jgi:hypothetical protein
MAPIESISMLVSNLRKQKRPPPKTHLRGILIVREPEAAGGELVRAYFARKGLEINIAVELSSHEAIKVAMAEGLVGKKVGIARQRKSKWIPNPSMEINTSGCHFL